MCSQTLSNPRSHRARFSYRLAGLLRWVLTAGALAAVSRAELKPGDPFPSLTTAELAGGTLPPLNGKVLVVDFWASWCAPCKASFPALGKVAADYAARGVVVIGVSVDEQASAFAGFVKKQAPAFLALHDARQKLVRAVQVPTMPTTYVVDRAGRIHAIHAGYHGETSDRQLRADLDALLAGKNP